MRKPRKPSGPKRIKSAAIRATKTAMKRRKK